MDYNEFKLLAGQMVGLDLDCYKSHQMDRRIQSLMGLWNIPDYEAFYRVLQEDPQRLKEFINKLTINVSEFFRNPERFETLKDRILPELLKSRKVLRVWSAGCSNGAEPYSVALLLNDLSPDVPHYILGTDVDQAILEKARRGIFNPNEVRCVPPEVLETQFSWDGKYYHLDQTIRNRVLFRFHDLLKDEFENEFDLIICRNVVIYLTEQAKDQLYQRFRESLKNDGFLFVGGTEPLLNHRQLGFEAETSGFYRKGPIVQDVFDYWRQIAAARQKQQE